MGRLPLVLTACLCLVWGCSLRPVNTPSFAGDPGIRRIDPNDGPFFLIETHKPDPRTGQMRAEQIIQWRQTTVRPDGDGVRTLTAKYRGLDFHLFSRVAVRVQLGDGHKYWALMDTGFPESLYVNDMVVRDCDLAVFPVGEHPETKCPQGICEIPVLRIGQAAVVNPPCWYEQRHWQFRVLGQPLYRDRTVLIGLWFMRTFPYILFDNVRREAVFGLYDAYEPSDPSEWVSVPFVLEEVEGCLRMMVDVSLGGRKTPVEFDTGGARPGLVLHDRIWQELGGAVGTRTRHASYQFGWLPCYRVVVPELRIGSLVLRNRKANVLTQESPFLECFDGLLSLEYFKKTSVVLDFRRNLIWIRKSS